MSPDEPTFLIVDANVLIDYCKSDRSVLGLISRHVGRLQVPLDVLKEVDQLGADELNELAIELVEPDLDTLMEAEVTKGTISFQDRLCFLLAKTNSWTCLSNDRGLRSICTADGISVMWGLEPMKILVREGRLGASEAIAIAETIHKSNPAYITTRIIRQFSKEVKRLIK